MDAITEALIDARDRISTEGWSFTEWGSCTCGHIYSVTRLGGRSTGEVSPMVIYYGAIQEGDLYREVLLAIRDAHPELEAAIADHARVGNTPERVVNAAFWVSDATALLADALTWEPDEDTPKVASDNAIQLINETIAHRLAEQRATMREVATSRTDEREPALA